MPTPRRPGKPGGPDLRSKALIWEYGLINLIPILMKTTLEIDDALLKRAKARALERGTTLRAVVEEALQRSLGLSTTVRAPLKLPTWPAQPSVLIHEDQVLAAIRSDRDGVGRAWARVDPAPADPEVPSRRTRSGADRPTRRGGSK